MFGGTGICGQEGLNQADGEIFKRCGTTQSALISALLEWIVAWLCFQNA